MTNTRPFLLHAMSGVGQAADVVDLPTARMKATGIPFVPSSSLNGVLRNARNTNGTDMEKPLAVFGTEREHDGALVVGDARLLAPPVRSFRDTFAWTTSPLLLTLAKRDLEEAELPMPGIVGDQSQFGLGLLDPAGAERVRADGSL